MQITFVGSAADSGYSDKAMEIAEELGVEMAKRGHVLLYGPERGMPSLPYFAGKVSRENGGMVIGVANGSARTEFYDKEMPSAVIHSESSFGAGREVVMVNSADAVISIGGGSGTLTEICIAYMNFIPVVAMKGSGGWSDKVIDTYIDSREKFKIPGATSAAEALDLAEKMYAEFGSQPGQLLASGVLDK